MHSLRQRAEYAGLRAALLIAPSLPYPALRALGSLIGNVVWTCDPRGRSVTAANLEAAFGSAIPPARRRRIGRASYANFARTMCELFWMDRAGADALLRRVEIEGLAHAACNATKGVAAIYPTLHFSNFEWLGLLCALVVEPGFVVAQRFRNPLLGPLFDRVRAATGHEVLPQERVMLRMLKHLKAGGKFGMLADLSLDPDEGSVVIEQFGGLKTSVTQLHAALALRTGAQLVPVAMRPAPGGTYKAVFHPTVAFNQETPAHVVCQRTWDALEPSIHAHPECWLWSYKHWRFRPSSGDTTRYPFYSNPAKRFDKLLRTVSAQRE